MGHVYYSHTVFSMYQCLKVSSLITHYYNYSYKNNHLGLQMERLVPSTNAAVMSTRRRTRINWSRLKDHWYSIRKQEDMRSRTVSTLRKDTNFLVMTQCCVRISPNCVPSAVQRNTNLQVSVSESFTDFVVQHSLYCFYPIWSLFKDWKYVGIAYRNMGEVIYFCRFFNRAISYYLNINFTSSNSSRKRYRIKPNQNYDCSFNSRDELFKYLILIMPLTLNYIVHLQ